MQIHRIQYANTICKYNMLYNMYSIYISNLYIKMSINTRMKHNIDDYIL